MIGWARSWFAILLFAVLIAGCSSSGGGGTAALSNAKDIIVFYFTSPSAAGVIDEDAKTIFVIVPKGTTVAALTATFITSGVTVKVGPIVQVSGTTANNYANTVQYAVTAEDNTTATYAVSVVVSLNPGTSAIILAKTGQTACYDSSGAAISCAAITAVGQNGALQKGISWPQPRFTTNGDTSVTDKLTGLVWAQNGNLMSIRDTGWDGDNNANDGNVTWQHALDYVAKLNAEDYLGHRDWRLPNRKELKSLVNYGHADAAVWLNAQGFADAKAGYWSASTQAGDATQAWFAALYDGGIYNATKGTCYSVWPVRGGQNGILPADQPRTGQDTCYDSNAAIIPCADTGQDGALQKGIAWPSPRFTTNSDTSVTDNLTGLAWVPSGNLMTTRDPGWDTDYVTTNNWESVNDGLVNWQHALDYVAKLNAENYLGHNDWRLPDVNERESLVNAGQSNIALWLNTQGFTNVQAVDYWSSTTFAGNTNAAWVVNMHNGGVGHGVKAGRYTYYVWPVRAGE